MIIKLPVKLCLSDSHTTQPFELLPANQSLSGKDHAPVHTLCQTYLVPGKKFKALRVTSCPNLSYNFWQTEISLDFPYLPEPEHMGYLHVFPWGGQSWLSWNPLSQSYISLCFFQERFLNLLSCGYCIRDRTLSFITFLFVLIQPIIKGK